MKQSRWDQRIQRADELAAAHPFAAEVLRFYRKVAACQKGLYCYLQESRAADLSALATKFPEFLCQIEDTAPEPIVQSAREWKTRDARGLLESQWQSVWPASTPEALLASLALQAYAEHLAERVIEAPAHRASQLCPFCSRKPAVGVLRPQGEGASRSLICAMCATEWPFGRIQCPACGEEDVDKLAVYTADQFPHVRVEACDTCGCYIKTVDLAKNGRAVPIVDELATIPLNLWAQDHQYVKTHVNILGI
jgi:FdhE protein